MNMPSPPPRNIQRALPPGYSLASQMARLHHMGRAHSQEVTSSGIDYYQAPDEDGKFAF